MLKLLMRKMTIAMITTTTLFKQFKSQKTKQTRPTLHTHDHACSHAHMQHSTAQQLTEIIEDQGRVENLIAVLDIKVGVTPPQKVTENQDYPEGI